MQLFSGSHLPPMLYFSWGHKCRHLSTLSLKQTFAYWIHIIPLMFELLMSVPELGHHDALPRDRLPLPPCEKLCGDSQRKEDTQMHQVDWAPRQVFCLWLRWTCEQSGAELRWWRDRFNDNYVDSLIITQTWISVVFLSEMCNYSTLVNVMLPLSAALSW